MTLLQPLPTRSISRPLVASVFVVALLLVLGVLVTRAVRTASTSSPAGGVATLAAEPAAATIPCDQAVPRRLQRCPSPGADSASRWARLDQPAGHLAR
jgi:hypothetical protein